MNSNNKNTGCSLDELTIKEALKMDIKQVSSKTHILVDPAPLPMIPITPFVIGRKMVKGTKNFIRSAKNHFE